MAQEGKGKKALLTLVLLILGVFVVCGVYLYIKHSKKVDTYFKDGYILISTPEQFVECFSEDIYIPGYDFDRSNDPTPAGHALEEGIIAMRSPEGIKGYKLINDLDFTDVDISPVNYLVSKNWRGAFKYNLDGNGFALKNINMNCEYASVFGTIAEDAVIKNLTIQDSTFNGSRYVGTFFSYVDKNCKGTIEDCHVVNCQIGSRTTESVGGLCGYMESPHNLTIGTINVKDSKIEGSINVGGAIGYYHSKTDSTISNLYVLDCTVEGHIETGEDANVGGVIGLLTTDNSAVEITSVNNYGANVSGYLNRVGGVVGNVYVKTSLIASNNKIKFNDCMNFSSVTGANYVGGICGQVGDDYAEITFENCNNLGNVFCLYNYAGGICGQVNTNNIITGHTATFNNCASKEPGELNEGSIVAVDKTIRGEEYIGGICGKNGKFYNCTNEMDIICIGSNLNTVGAIVGQSTYTPENCTNTGAIILD